MTLSPSIVFVLGAVLPLTSTLATFAQAQSLPPPSRTVYRCEDAGKVVYSDSPCLGARKVDVEPTRGLNKSTGQVRTGRDVQREQLHEGIAGALRPLTGMSDEQFKTEVRRQSLAPNVKQECGRLDREIPSLEHQESTATAGALPGMQKRLLGLRTRYRELKC